jgi:hypothetical protein
MYISEEQTRTAFANFKSNLSRGLRDALGLRVRPIDLVESMQREIKKIQNPSKKFYR